MNSVSRVLLSVMKEFALTSAFGSNWRDVLEHVSDGVLVMDEERQIRFVNDRARRILGYEDGQRVVGRCRHNTRGVDCEIACPLTFALEQGLAEVRDFETVYRGRNGRGVPLRVTVVPLFGEDGTFVGAVEFLAVREIDPGFFLAGKGPVSRELVSRLSDIAAADSDVVLVGERAARMDVARAMHRFSGMPREQFVAWPIDRKEIDQFPVGMCFADDGHADALWQSDLPTGWRRIIGLAEPGDFVEIDGRAVERVHLPSTEALREDLPLQLTAWIRQLRDDLEVSGEALDHLVEIALTRGFDGVQEILPAAVAIADGRLEREDLSGSSAPALLIDRALESEDPLGAVERQLLTEVLERVGWRMQEAADLLGMSRVTLWRKTRDHGIERPSGLEAGR